MRRRMVQALVVAAVVAAAGAAAQAAPIVDTFSIKGQTENVFIEGSGSGWDGGLWIKYGVTNWWNQWFYDHPPDPMRWKEIAYDILVAPAVPVPGAQPYGEVVIALNWSTLAFPETGPGGAPPMSDQEPFIMREIIYRGPAYTAAEVVGTFSIPDYNPEWVSIDVRFDHLWQWNVPLQRWQPYAATVSGTIAHECLPEPATLTLLALGGLGAVAARRRTR